MGFLYTNSLGDNYYLHKGLTKKGNTKYWFSKKMDGDLVNSIPDNYEIYEEPNGMVYLRKIQPQIFSKQEIKTIESNIPKNLNYKIDTKKNIITIFLSEGLYSRYQPLMRFVLVDKKDRIFEAQRFCFKGSIDDWIELDSSEYLNKLANKCCTHLGKDSFYDLPYMVDGF
ncbi:MAG: hypothetical protein ABF289_16995 [Clostridiales bacterium]